MSLCRPFAKSASLANASGPVPRAGGHVSEPVRRPASRRPNLRGILCERTRSVKRAYSARQGPALGPRRPRHPAREVDDESRGEGRWLRIPDEVRVQMEPLLPERPPHPLGCHNPRVPDREAMNAILLVLRTGDLDPHRWTRGFGVHDANRSRCSSGVRCPSAVWCRYRL